jgi:uncharacterized membrane protein HdeD (DUF308 family)
MANNNRKFIDSHWLNFILRGVLTLFFAWIVLSSTFTGKNQLIAFVAFFLLVLSTVDLINAVFHSHNHRRIFTDILMSLVDLGVAISLFITTDYQLSLHVVLISGYVAVRGLIDILTAYINTKDPTDRFIWILSGVVGFVMAGIIMFQSNLVTSNFIHFFGAYFAIVGICNLIYGAHNQNQEYEEKIARATAHKRVAAAKTPAKKTAKKTAKKGKK